MARNEEFFAFSSGFIETRLCLVHISGLFYCFIFRGEFVGLLLPK